VTSGDGFAVTARALTGHAGTVDAVAAAVQTAHDAAKQVTMGVEAYGTIPTRRMMPVLLEPLQGRAVTSLLAAVRALPSGPVPRLG